MEILCGQCGRNVSVQDSSAVACPHCGHSILLPRIEGSDIADGPDAGVAKEASQAPRRATEEDEGFAANARQAMLKKLRAVCGSCGKGLSINPKHAGRTGRCPACGGKIQIPKLPEEEIDFPVVGQPEGYVDDIELVEEPGPDTDPAGAPADLVSQGGRLPNPLVPSKEDSPAEEPHQPQPEPFLEPTAAASADAPERTGSAIDSQEWVQESELAGQSSQDASPKRMGKWLKVLVGVGCAGLIAALGLVIVQDARHKPGERTAISPGQPTSQGAAGIGAQTASAPSVAQVVPDPGHVGPSVSSCRIASCSLSVFAPGGVLPAAPDRFYCMVQVDISAAGQEVRVDLAKDVSLSVDGTDIACLGLPADCGGGLRRAKRAVVTIPAGTVHTDTLVFDVPASARAGTLKVRGLPDVTTMFDRPEATLANAELAGTWAEISPRALKPLLKDPVCAAIQDTPPQDQRLIVSVVKNTFTVRMPIAGVGGVATKIPEYDRLFDAELTGPGTTLKCKLRLAQGPRLVLYLQDEPFYQLVFGKLPPTTQASSK